MSYARVVVTDYNGDLFGNKEGRVPNQCPAPLEYKIHSGEIRKPFIIVVLILPSTRILEKFPSAVQPQRHRDAERT